MKKIQFSIIDISYSVDKTPQINLFGRTTDNQQICVIEDFQPYFYVLAKNIEDFTSKVSKVEVEDNDRIAKVVSTEIVDKKYLGDEGAVYSELTGSGAAVIGIFNENTAIDHIINKLKNDYSSVQIIKTLERKLKPVLE